MFCTSSALFTLVMEPKIVFFRSLTREFIIFSSGISISWGCLCWILCKTSKGINPLGNRLSKVILSKLFTSIFLGIFTSIQVIDLPCNVHWPFVITNCFDDCGVILKARNLFLMVRKCYLLCSMCSQFCNYVAMVNGEKCLVAGCLRWRKHHWTLSYLIWILCVLHQWSLSCHHLQKQLFCWWVTIKPVAAWNCKT